MYCCQLFCTTLCISTYIVVRQRRPATVEASCKNYDIRCITYTVVFFTSFRVLVSALYLGQCYVGRARLVSATSSCSHSTCECRSGSLYGSSDEPIHCMLEAAILEALKQGVLQNCLSPVAHSFDSRLSLFSTMIMSQCFAHSMHRYTYICICVSL